MLGLLMVSTVAEHRLWDTWAQWLRCVGSVALLHVGLPGPGVEPMSPGLAGRFSSTVPPGKSQLVLFDIRLLFLFTLLKHPSVYLEWIFGNYRILILSVGFLFTPSLTFKE